MRTKLLLLFACWAMCLWAERIPVEQARKMATEFFRHNRPQLAVNSLKMVYDGETAASRSAGAEPAFYVFDNPDGKGFVIISGDDIAQPVLGYSYENDFLMEQLPVNVEGWLESLKKQVNDGRKYGVVSLPDSRSLSRAGDVVVKLETAQWNQWEPYNNLLSTIDGQLPPTGCVITAAAIVMRYHKWPEKGVGTVPGYTTQTLKIERPAIKLGHTYEWDKMPLVYKYNEYTEEQGKQVARLMLDLGTMLGADYGLSGTSAYVPFITYRLNTYMGYDKGAFYRDRSNYSDTEWHELIKNELNQGRPIIYDGGGGNRGGHAFVLDGYTASSFYSVNWGWGGSYNGYFLLNALVPSGNENDHFNLYQGAITGLMPDQGGGGYFEEIVLGDGGISSDTTDFERYRSFQLLIGSLVNRGDIFNGYFLFALTDKSGNIKEELFSIEGGIVAGARFRDIEKNCTITVPIEIGDRIRGFYKNYESTEWKLMKGLEDCVWELLVADEFTIDETTSIRRNKSQKTIVVTTKDGVHVEWVHSDGSPTGDCYQTVDNVTTIHTEGLPAGDYLLKLKKAFESREVKIKLGATSGL